MVFSLAFVSSAWQEDRWLSLLVPCLLIGALTSFAVLYASYSPDLAKGRAPKRITFGEWPIVGALQFFSQRKDFFFHAKQQSPTGNFSFQLGRYHVVGLSGSEARKKILESRDLSLFEGYGALFNGAPAPPREQLQDGEETSNAKHLSTRITQMMKREAVHGTLPDLTGDTKTRLLELARQDTKITDPFESVYRIVFQLTMRTVGCKEIAEDDKRRERMLALFERVDESATPWLILFPWMPLYSKFKRLAAGAQLWGMIQAVINDRKKTGRRETDPLQMQIDAGDDTLQIITVIMAALFAGQLNSGINAAWLLMYLADQPQWQTKIREELKETCDKYVADKNLPLLDQLCSLDMDEWEHALPTLDVCLKECIRLQSFGTIFRRNAGRDMRIGNEVVPHGAMVVYHIDDVHSNPDIYPNPERWDPSRYERGEDKKEPYAFMGWGASRHPCSGMRFAKLEMIIIVGMFLAAFDYDLSDEHGGPGTVPELDRNNHHAARPEQKVYLKYTVRENAF